MKHFLQWVLLRLSGAPHRWSIGYERAEDRHPGKDDIEPPPG